MDGGARGDLRHSSQPRPGVTEGLWAGVHPLAGSRASGDLAWLVRVEPTVGAEAVAVEAVPVEAAVEQAVHRQADHPEHEADDEQGDERGDQESAGARTGGRGRPDV